MDYVLDLYPAYYNDDDLALFASINWITAAQFKAATGKDYATK